MPVTHRTLGFTAIPAILGLILYPARAADKFQVEYDFDTPGVYQDVTAIAGYYTPGQPLTWALYGTLNHNTPNSDCHAGSCGVVFKLSPPPPRTAAPWTETPVYDFRGIEGLTSQDGSYPMGRLTFDRSGAIYGATLYGGKMGYGTVYKLTPLAAGATSWSEATLYSFQYGTDGGFPVTGVILDGSGALYGTANTFTSTSAGNVPGAVVFKLAPPVAPSTGWTYTVLHSFSGAEGISPQHSLVMDPAGALYGTMSLVEHPGADRGGNAFKLTPPASPGGTWTYQVIYSFASAAGSSLQPSSAFILDASGSLYGTTTDTRGPSNTVFRLDPPTAGGTAWRHTVLHTLTGPDGYPDGLIAFHGTLYGVTGNAFNTTAFQLTPPASGQGAWTFATLYTFPRPDTEPTGALAVDAKGNLYGAGSIGDSVFKIFTATPATP